VVGEKHHPFEGYLPDVGLPRFRGDIDLTGAAGSSTASRSVGNSQNLGMAKHSSLALYPNQSLVFKGFASRNHAQRFLWAWKTVLLELVQKEVVLNKMLTRKLKS
jgi:hypothetical protein